MAWLVTFTIFLMSGIPAFAADDSSDIHRSPAKIETAGEHNNSDIQTSKNDVKSVIDFSITPMEATTMYITNTVYLRSIPDKSGKLLGTLYSGNEVTVVGVIEQNPYNRFVYYVTDRNEYIHGNYISSDKPPRKTVAGSKH